MAQASAGDSTVTESPPTLTVGLVDQFEASSSQPDREAPPALSEPSSRGNVTFLVQSEPSTPNATPTSSFTGSDRFAHTRGKRRRTSPEDFAILEAEYEHNPRPDKITRTGIVARVSMTDKEVQIWFQNRRQISRRKARTWQPNAITSIIRESHQQSPIDDKTSFSFSTSSSQPPSSSQLSTFSQPPSSSQPTSSSQSSSSQPQLTSSQSQLSHDESVAHSTQGSTEPKEGAKEILPDYSTTKQEVEVKEPKSQEDQENERNVSQESLNAPSDLQCESHEAVLESGNDAGHNFKAQGLGIMTGHDAQPTSSCVAVATCDHSSEEKPPAKRRSVRLVCSEAGLAEVVLKSASVTPEKPKPKPTTVDALPSIRGEEVTSKQPTPASASSSVHVSSKSRVHGRSRDARVWEFYCDSDSREALTTFADRECKGSALGKLSLIRSNSAGSKPLLPTKKHNVQPARDEQAKRKDASALDKKRPKLARTSSSLARLQHNQDKGVLGGVDPKKGKGAKDVAIFEDPDGDSDKENWEPGTQISRPRYRSFANPARVNAILRENTREMSYSSSLGAMMGRERARKDRSHPKHGVESPLLHDKENAQVDEEVAQFMGEESFRQSNDVDDAVHSLLSLSQGEWR